MASFAPKAITSSGDPVTWRYLAKIFIVCLSFANLCFLNVWAEMNSADFDALRKYGETWQKLAAVTLDVLILAVALWGPFYVALLTAKSAWILSLKWSIIVGLLLPANIVRTYDPVFSSQQVSIPHALGWRILILLGGVAAAIFLVVHWERICTRVTTVLLLLLAPSMPLSFGGAAWRIWQGPPHSLYPDQPLLPA